jgi:hypothetical protein
MDRLLWTVAAVLASAALTLGLIWAKNAEFGKDAPDASRTDRREWVYSWPGTSSYRNLPERFDLVSLVTLPSRRDCALRFVVNADGQSSTPRQGVYLDIDALGVTVGRIEGGIALARGRAAAKVLVAQPHEVALKRRGNDLAVTIDGELALLARDQHMHRGGTAIGLIGNVEVELKPLAKLPELPEFSDDFMRAPDDPSPWVSRAGTWEVESLPMASMSANAFSFRGKSQEGTVDTALASTGSSTWDQYRFCASVRGESDETMGLAFGIREDRGYLLFRWSARTKNDVGRREIVLVDSLPSGEVVETVLAAAEGGYLSEQWYRLEVDVSFGRAVARIDGIEVLAADSPRVASGSVGLWSRGAKGATFDDILVVPMMSIAERLVSSPDNASTDWEARWDAVGGTWLAHEGRIAADAADSDRDVKLLSASGEWRTYVARSTVDPVLTGRAGIVANYVDESSYVLLAVDARRARIVLEVVGGGERFALAEAPLPEGRTFDLCMRSSRGYLAGSVNGQLLVQGRDEHVQAGRIGLWVDRHSRASFGSFEAQRMAHEHQVGLKSPVFVSDTLMSGWAGENADWYRSAESTPDRDIYWHSAPFNGDVELAIDLPQMEVPTGKVVIGVGKSGDKPRNGYGWLLEAGGANDEAGGNPWHLSFSREGELLKELTLDSGQQVDSVFVRRQGGSVAAGINGDVLTHYIDPEPLAGGRVAYMAEGLDIDPSRTRLYGGTIFDYVFSEAPVEWRVAAGRWEITSRWKCDPRWSFFSGMVDTDSNEKAVVIWNKHLFPGDLVLDFYVGPKMEPDKGKRYEYVHDFNVTISADGKDVSSGYSFMFAGFNNSRTGIYKGTEALVETREVSARVPASMIIHQRWYHVRVERSGSLLKYRVNFNGRNVVSLECEDPEPLSGDRLAIWSYDCNIMVARMRVATSEEGGARESPDFQPPVRTTTIYDLLPLKESEE